MCYNGRFQLSTPFSGFGASYSMLWHRPIVFQLPFRDSSTVKLPDTSTTSFQLPFRDSLSTSLASSMVLALSTPFSGFYNEVIHVMAGDRDLSTPFSGFHPPNCGLPHMWVIFQLPFRDSEYTSYSIPSPSGTFNSLFGIPARNST